MGGLNSPKTIKFLQFWFVPLLLIVIALRQLFLVSTVKLTPWKGGGFGMFSSIDRPSNRVVEVRGITKSGRSLEIDLAFENEVISPQQLKLIKTVPKQQLLELTAEKILNSDLRTTRIEGIYRLQAKDKYSDLPGKSTLNIETVKIRIWHLQYDSNQNIIWYEPLTEIVEAKRS